MADVITAMDLRALFDYRRGTGEFLRKKDGKVCGGANSRGYLTIRIANRLYYCHRLAFLWVTGGWPKVVDHANGVLSDNRWSNLRDGTQGDNLQNLRGAKSNNKSSGVLGVSLGGCGSKLRARIKVGGREVHLGYFGSAEDASAAYLAAKADLHHFAPPTGG